MRSAPSQRSAARWRRITAPPRTSSGRFWTVTGPTPTAAATPTPAPISTRRPDGSCCSSRVRRPSGPVASALRPAAPGPARPTTSSLCSASRCDRPGGGLVDLTNDDVADILALLDSLPYDALDLRTDRFHLTLRRTPGGGWTEESELLTQPTDVTPEVSETSGAGGSGEMGRQGRPGVDENVLDENVLDAAADADRLVAVVAPLPGTFYRAPRPGAPPFVSEGDAVGADTVVAIIE